MRTFDPEQDRKILALLAEGKDGYTVAREVGVSRSTVTNAMRRNGIVRKNGRPRERAVDEAAFDDITRESAYWAGFLCADGCVGEYSGYRAVILELAEKDTEHVYKFRAFLKSDHAVYKTERKERTIKSKTGLITTAKANTTTAFRVSSARLVERLHALGCVKKSKERRPCAELLYSADFWRGAIDGDGTVRMFEKDGYRYASIILCGHIPVLESFQSFLARQGLSANITDTASGIFQIRMLGKGALALIKTLYADAPVALTRKHEAAKAIISEMDQKASAL